MGLSADEIAARATRPPRPGEATCRRLSLRDARELAREADISVRAVESQALAQQILPARYARNLQSLSITEQQTLAMKTACVVGVGGLGGSVAEVLARIGVGRLILVDGDVFEEHNLNRQRFAHTGNLGQPKARAARDAIARINPAVDVEAHAVFLTAANAADLIADAAVVVDCLDRLDTRLVLQRACRRQGVPLVSAAVAGTTGQLTVIFPEDAGWEQLAGDVGADDARGAEMDLGNLPFTVNALASMEAAEAVKLLLDRGEVLRNRLLVFDLLEPYFEIIALDAGAPSSL